MRDRDHVFRDIDLFSAPHIAYKGLRNQLKPACYFSKLSLHAIFTGTATINSHLLSLPEDLLLNVRAHVRLRDIIRALSVHFVLKGLPFFKIKANTQDYSVIF